MASFLPVAAVTTAALICVPLTATAFQVSSGIGIGIGFGIDIGIGIDIDIDIDIATSSGIFGGARRVGPLQMTDKRAGTFFNEVPDQPEEGEEEMAGGSASPAADPFDFDSSMAELLSRKKDQPLAAKPSTIAGVPTAKATGFGKKPAASKRAASKPPKVLRRTGDKNFIELGKPVNDVNNPEYDDQGYTLYADEETGEKKRVFEALVEYPCKFTMKIVGASEGNFASDMVQIVADSCGVTSADVENSLKINGKWTSVTVKAPVENAEMLYSLYENIDCDPRVKFKF